MQDEIYPSVKSTSVIEECLEDKGNSLLQAQRSALIILFETHKLTKVCQKLTLISLNMHPVKQRKQAYKEFIDKFSQNLFLYTEIDQKTNLRAEILSSLIQLSQQQKCINKKFINDAYNKIEQYRLGNLEYVEGLLKLCKFLSHQDDKIYDKILAKCGRIFIKLHNTTINNNILPYLFEFSETFDPLLIELRGKNQYINFKLQHEMTQDTRLKTRLDIAHRQIMKSINQNQIKMTSDNKKQQNQTYKIPIVKYNNELSKVKTQNFFETNNTMELKPNFKIKIRQNKIITRSKDKIQSKQSSSQKIVQNFRKKSLQHRINTSVDTTNQYIAPLQPATISTNNYRERHQKSIRSNERYTHVPKRLNFRAINLQPLENVNMSSSFSSGNMAPVEGLEHEKSQIENRSIFNLKRKSRKQKYQDPRTDKSVQGEFSDFDSPGSTQKSVKKYPSPSSNKLSLILSKRNFRKFESDEDLSSGISDESSAQFSVSSDFNCLKKISKSKKTNPPLIDETMISQYRKRRISEVDQDSNKELSRTTTPQAEEIQKEMAKLRLKNQRKDDDQMLESTTNIESKGEEIQEYRYTEEIIKFKNQGKKQQISIENELTKKSAKDLPIIGPSDAQPLGQILSMQSSESQNTSLQGIQHQKPEQNKIKRKIILKASKVNLQQIPKYLEKLGYLNYDALAKQISLHQHYICEFYLNQTIFNLIVFCPSLDFRNIEIKLIHEVEHPQTELFQSSNVKEKFRKVVLQNYIQIMEKSASLIFASIVIKNPTSEQMLMKDCGFVQTQDTLIYSLKASTSRQKTRQFLTIYGSIFSIKQKVNQTFLYSDQISPFKGGKYDISDMIFNGVDVSLIPTFTCKGLKNMTEINEILQLKELDTFEVSASAQALIFQQSQVFRNEADLRTFTLEQILNKNFIIANGWIKTTSSLIFHDKNQKISQIILLGNYEIYFGKGFEHIGTMKNKITHYKTRKSSKKNSQPTATIYPTKIRMFSKQLYGLIKHQNDIAYYGNWEMNFHFKHEFLGKVIHSIDTQSSENRLIFGNQTFFVTIYQGDQFVIGWEVEENDFLY